MKIKKISLILFTILLCNLFIGCGEKVNSKEIRKYSDKIVEDTLLSLNNSDVEKYIGNFDEKLKNKLPKDKVDTTFKTIKDKIGTYEEKSLKFQKAVKQSKDNKKYITVIYTGKFTDEPKDVVITVVFLEEDSNHKLQTFLLNSPKLKK